MSGAQAIRRRLAVLGRLKRDIQAHLIALQLDEQVIRAMLAIESRRGSRADGGRDG